MTCCSRSTHLFAEARPRAWRRRWPSGVPVHAVGAGSCDDLQVKAAIQSPSKRGSGSRWVTLDHFACALTAATPQPLAATPDPWRAPAGRSFCHRGVGGPRGHAVRLGEATAMVHVSGAHVRATRVLAPGGTLTAGDLEVVTGPLDGLRFDRCRRSASCWAPGSCAAWPLASRSCPMPSLCRLRSAPATRSD